jgi:chromodomain-helicase-DNA-binding protein 1
LPASPRSCRADIVVFQQAASLPGIGFTMSPSPEPGSVNGHADSPSDAPSIHTPSHGRSGSELSDAQPVGALASESEDAADSPDEGPESAAEEEHDEESHLSDSSDNHDAADDEDFNAHGSPASVASPAPNSELAAGSNQAAAKRKAAQAIEDEYMRVNPELYGLRRSV